MVDRNYPVYINDEAGNPIRVGWASEELENGLRDILMDVSGPGKEALDIAAQGPAQGFTYGEPVITEENN